MKKALLPLLAVLILPAAAAAQQALLWVPARSAEADEIVSLLENDKKLRLTAALGQLPAALQERVKRLEAEGRLETALRPAGDPPLPLLYYPSLDSVKWENKPSTATLPANSPFFLGLRLGLARDEALKTYKKIPAGLVLPPGGLLEDYFPLAKALGAKWLACGPLASTGPAVTDVNGTKAVSFSVHSASAAPGELTVFDETSALDPAAEREALKIILKDTSTIKVTVSEALRLRASTQAAPGDIAAAVSPWTGGYGRWAGNPAQLGALAALAQTRSELMRYLNASQGDMKAAKPAFDEYFNTEDGARLMALASPDPETASETEIELRSSLGNVYRLMGKTPPSWAFSSLTEVSQVREAPGGTQVSVSTSGFEIKNGPERPDLPAPPAGLAKTADPYKIWKLDRMTLEILPDSLIFRFYPLELDNAGRLPSGFDRVAIDLYIDVNNRPRAGFIRPLTGRPLRLYPDNAWEYALEINPYRASLYAYTSKGPVVAGTYRPKAVNGAITVEVPRSVLKGSPMLWGYAALMLTSKDQVNFSIADHIASAVDDGYIYTVRPGKK